MNPSYVLLVALLVAAAAAIYGTYLYMLDKAKDFHTEDVAAAIKALLDLEPGQSKTAHVAIPHGTTLKICSDKECRCGAPTCIVVTGPTTATVIRTTAEVIIQPSNYVLPAGTYIIKARAEPPDLEKTTICRVSYQFVADVQNVLSNTCGQAVQNVMDQLKNLPVARFLEDNLDVSLQDILMNLGINNPCDRIEDVPKAIYQYACIRKKIYIEVIPT
jgi:hypothetical protein